MWKPEALLLDFDGTITEPSFDWEKIRAEMGLEKILVLDAIKAAEGAEKRRLRSIMERYEAESVERTVLRKGAKRFIAWITGEGIPFAVITNNESRNVRAACERCGIEIPIAIGRECGFYKPFPEMPLIAARNLGVHAGKCLVIGDAWIDAKSARSAGMRAMIISDNRDIPADYYAPGLDEAAEIIRTLRRPA